MGIMVYSILWVMHHLYHEPCCLKLEIFSSTWCAELLLRLGTAVPKTSRKEQQFVMTGNAPNLKGSKITQYDSGLGFRGMWPGASEPGLIEGFGIGS